METKNLLSEIIEFLKSKYSVTGIAATDQVDGFISSAVRFALNLKNDTKEFKLILVEMPNSDK